MQEEKKVTLADLEKETEEIMQSVNENSTQEEVNAALMRMHNVLAQMQLIVLNEANSISEE
jgi:hypothetical protein